MRCFTALAATILLGASAGLSAAQTGTREDCIRANDPDVMIRACSRLIRRSPRDAAWYVNRGIGYRKKGDYDHAIADYNEAIRLKPGYAVAYNYRGIAYRRKGAYDRAIADYNEAIRLKPGYADAYISRGIAYRRKGDTVRAIADYDEAIRLKPDAVAYNNRGIAYGSRGETDRAIADYDEAIRLKPGYALAYFNRGDAYGKKGDTDRAIADYGVAIRLKPGYADAYISRGIAYRRKGAYDRAIADYDEAIRLKPGYAIAYNNRGVAYKSNGAYDRAIADYNEAIRLKPGYALAYFNRGFAYERQRNRAKAVTDYYKVLALPAGTREDRDRQADARKRIARLQAAAPGPATRPRRASRPGRRVALVIGNAAYQAVPDLPNPRRDVRDVAAALRDVGFGKVVERYDLGLADTRRTLSAFEDLARNADWAVVYYAGHGIEVDGRNFLVPVDARLRRDSDVEDEALPVERVLRRISVARKVQLLILDACRNNPFTRSMRRSGGATRSIGTRGLARVMDVPANLMIAYSAQAGEVALDGPRGGNSPYARALVKYLAVPGLEISPFFRKVRSDVLAATGGRQRPFEDSSLTDINLFFRYAARK